MIFQSWKGRGTLQTLVAELERQKASKVDFVADTRSVEIQQGEEKKLILSPRSMEAADLLSAITGKINTPSGAGVPIRELALDQLGSRLSPSIPFKFLKELSNLYPSHAINLLNGLMQDSPSRKFFRCLDGELRAVLSDRYRVLDHYDLAFSALDAARQVGGEVLECSLSDSHMRVRFISRQFWNVINESKTVDPHQWFFGGAGNQTHLRRIGARIGGELPGGPGTVYPMVTISNSEVGLGGFRVRIGLLRAICVNGAMLEDCISQIHLGEKMGEGIFTEETISAESKTIFLKARDMVKAAFNREHFNRLVEVANEAHSHKISTPIKAVENVTAAGRLSEKAKEAILSYFVSDYEMTRWGLGQAIGRTAQDEESGDSAADLEDLAGKVIKSDELLIGV